MILDGLVLLSDSFLILFFDQIDALGTAPPSSSTTVIWGTNINAETLQQKVADFLLTFREEDQPAPQVSLGDGGSGKASCCGD